MNTQEIQLYGHRNNSEVFSDIYSIAPDALSTFLRLTAITYCAKGRSWTCLPMVAGAEILAYLQKTFSPSSHSQTKNHLLTNRIQYLRQQIETTNNSRISTPQLPQWPSLNTSINELNASQEASIKKPKEQPLLDLIEKQKKLKKICNTEEPVFLNIAQSLSNEISKTGSLVKNDPVGLALTWLTSKTIVSMDRGLTALSFVNRYLPAPLVATAVDLSTKLILLKKPNMEQLVEKEACQAVKKSLEIQQGNEIKQLIEG